MPREGCRGKGGKGKAVNPDQKYLDKLKEIDSSLKVWVGGLDSGFPWKKLDRHVMEMTGTKPALVHVYPKGTACIACKEEDDVATIMETLNGSDLAGHTLETDVWTTTSKGEKKEKPKPAKVAAKVKKTIVKPAKGGKKETTLSPKMVEKLKATDASLKCWIGGLSAETTWKQLKDHFTEKGCSTKIVEIMRKGTAVITFETEDEVASAISAANGSELGGNTLEVDVWTKPERKEKGVKKEKVVDHGTAD